MANQKLLDLAEQVRRLESPDRDLDIAIARALGRSTKINVPYFTSSWDAVMPLIPKWMTPTIIGHDREVSLTNGIGYAVNGKNYETVAGTLLYGLLSAVLKAQADIIEDTENA